MTKIPNTKNQLKNLCIGIQVLLDVWCLSLRDTGVELSACLGFGVWCLGFVI